MDSHLAIVIALIPSHFISNMDAKNGQGRALLFLRISSMIENDRFKFVNAFVFRNRKYRAHAVFEYIYIAFYEKNVISSGNICVETNLKMSENLLKSQ